MPKISELPVISTLTGAELIPAVQSSATKESTLTTIATWVVRTFAGFLPAGTGAVAGTVQNKLREIVSVKDFGAVGDGITDDTTALNKAFAIINATVFIPRGTYLFTSDLAAPVCAAIIGEGQFASILKPGASCTRGLSIGSATYPGYFARFGLNGILTTNAIGIFFGEASSIGCRAEEIYVQNFTGASAIAYRFGDVLKSHFKKLTAFQSQTGFKLQGVTGSFPTTLHFETCGASSITGIGESVITAYGTIHTNCWYESCGAEGVKIVAAGSDVEKINWNSCWFEANNGNVNTKYHFVCGDNVSVRTMRAVSVDNCYFDTNTGGTAAKAIQMNGSTVGGFRIAYPEFVSSYANSISIENEAYGTIDSWNFAWNYDTIVSDANQRVAKWFGNYIAYTPTYSSDIGNAATTFNGAVTTSLARYKIVGKRLYITFFYGATLNAVTPNYIILSIPLPTGTTLQNNGTYTPITIRNNGVWETGIIRTDGAASLYVYRMGFANYTASGAVSGTVSAVFELN